MQQDPSSGTNQPAVTVTDITEPTTAGVGFELVEQEVVQLEPMPLRARRVIVRLGAAAVVLHSAHCRLRTTSRIHDGLLAYAMFGANAHGTVNGLPVRPGLMVALQPGTEASLVTEPGWESVTLLLPPAEVRAHLAARHREHEFLEPHGIETLEAAPDRVRAVFDWGKRLSMTAARQPDIFDKGKNERRAAEVELFERFLPVLGGAHPLEPTRNDRTGQAHADIVRIAEAYALSRVGEHLSVSDLCREAGVSERTLEYAFHHVLGLTPVAYLVRLRLHRVRQGLLAGTHATTTVTTEALNWGFWHFGEFSRAYKECFGELPSDTLRRPPPPTLTPLARARDAGRGPMPRIASNKATVMLNGQRDRTGAGGGRVSREYLSETRRVLEEAERQVTAADAAAYLAAHKAFGRDVPLTQRSPTAYRGCRSGNLPRTGPPTGKLGLEYRLQVALAERVFDHGEHLLDVADA